MTKARSRIGLPHSGQIQWQDLIDPRALYDRGSSGTRSRLPLSGGGVDQESRVKAHPLSSRTEQPVGVAAEHMQVGIQRRADVGNATCRL